MKETKRRNDMKTLIKGALLCFLVIATISCSLFQEVKEPEIPVDSITVDEESVYIGTGEQKLISVAINPTQYSARITVDNQNSEVADAEYEAGILTIVGKETGSTLIRLISGNVSSAVAVNVVGDGVLNPSIYLVPTHPVINMDLEDTFETSVKINGITSNFGYVWTIDDPEVASLTTVDNRCVIVPKDTGSTLIKVSHPSTDFGCEIILMVGDIVADNARVITSSLNIVTLYDTGTTKNFTVGLTNSDKSELSKMTFSVTDPTIASVIYNNEEAIITPKKSGITTLTISHPLAKYPHKILVNVVSKTFQNYITTSKNYVELSGNRLTVTASINGSGSVNDITWTSNNPNIVRVLGYGSSVFFEGGNFSGETTVTVSHPSFPITTTIYVYNKLNTVDANNDAYYLQASSNYLKLCENQFKMFYLYENSRSAVNPIGIINETMSCFIEDPNIMTIEESDLNEYRIIGLDVGVTKVTWRSEKTNKTIELTVAVYPEGTDLDAIQTPYLSTDINVVYLNESTYYKKVQVDMKGSFGTIPDYTPNPQDFVVWSCDSDIIEVIPNGASAVIKPKKVGECWLEVSHPESANKIKYSVVVEGVPKEIMNPYITTLDNVVTLAASGTYYTINVDGMGITNPLLYAWSMEDNTVARVEAAGETAKVWGLRVGTTKLTVSHPESEFPLEILIDVLPEGSVITNDPYITSNYNIVSVLGDGATKTIDVTLRRGVEADNANFVWAIDDSTVCSMVATGNRAALKALKAGETEITVSHPLAKYPFKIKVITYEIKDDGTIVGGDGNTPGGNGGTTTTQAPYITTTDNVVTLVAEGSTFTLNVKGVGTDPAVPFVWAVGNTSILNITDYGTKATLRGLAEGETSIVISHPQAPFPLTVIVKILPVGSVLVREPYISSGDNIVTLKAAGGSRNVTATIYGLSTNESYSLQWTNNASAICSMTASGGYATLVPKAVGQGEIVITHPNVPRPFVMKVIVTDGSTVGIGPYITTTKEIYIIEKDEAVSFVAKLENATTQDQANFSFSVDSTDMVITSNGNTCYCNASGKAGIYKVTITHPLAGIAKQITIVVNSTDPDDLSNPGLIKSNYITTGQRIIFIEAEGNVSIKANLVNGLETDKKDFAFSRDSSSFIDILSNSEECVITPRNSGITKLTITHPKATYPSEVIVVVAFPWDDVSLSDLVFIENSNQFIKVVEGSNTSTLGVTMVGGVVTDNANFVWTSEDTSIATVIGNANTGVITGVKEGKTRIKITNPKTVYPAYIVVDVGKKPIGTTITITSQDSIVSMTPKDQPRTLKVTLTNGKIEDTNSIRWEIDNPTIVSMTSVRDTAVITPLAQGVANITVTQPLSNNTLTFKINVSEYYTFSFSKQSTTIVQGKNEFVPLRYPANSLVPTVVTYTTTDPSVVTIRGTTAVAEITAVGPGSATVMAKSNKGSEAIMLIRVDAAPPGQVTEIYIACAKTSFEANENGASVSIMAELIGGTDADQQGLTWRSSDVSVISLLGSGKSVIATPKGRGNAEITITHPKSSNEFKIYVNVKGVTYNISLNNTYMQVKQGETAELIATLDGAPALAYDAIIWRSSNDSVARVTGVGKKVNILGVSGGSATITAQYPDGNIKVCEIDVDPTPYIVFGCASSLSIKPGEAKKITYTHNPPYENITLQSSDATKVSYTVNHTTREITLYGNDYGTVSITGEIRGVQSVISVTCKDVFSVTPSISTITGAPRIVNFTYDCYPSTSTVEVLSSDTGIFTVFVDNATKKVTVTPKGTGSGFITVKNHDSVVNIPVTFTAPAMTYSYAIRWVDGITTGNFTYSTGKKIVARDGETFYLEIIPSNPYIPVEIISVMMTTGTGYEYARTNNVSAFTSIQMDDGPTKQVVKSGSLTYGIGGVSVLDTNTSTKILKLSAASYDLVDTRKLQTSWGYGGGMGDPYVGPVYSTIQINPARDKTFTEVWVLKVVIREGGVIKTIDVPFDINIFNASNIIPEFDPIGYFDDGDADVSMNYNFVF
jgi:hypothetical protein